MSIEALAKQHSLEEWQLINQSAGKSVYQTKGQIIKLYSDKNGYELPAYKHYQHFYSNYRGPKLKAPQLSCFGRIQEDKTDFVICEKVTGSNPNSANWMELYGELLANPLKPLRQSEPQERTAWDWWRPQLKSHNKRAYSYLAAQQNQPRMIWSHASFWPEHLVNDHLINFSHFTYQPLHYAIAYYFAVNTPASLDEYQQAVKILNLPHVEHLFYNQIAFCLSASAEDQFTVELLDWLLDKINA